MTTLFVGQAFYLVVMLALGAWLFPRERVDRTLQ